MKSEGLAKLEIAVSIFADRNTIQNDHCMLDTRSVRTGWISTEKWKMSHLGRSSQRHKSRL